MGAMGAGGMGMSGMQGLVDPNGEDMERAKVHYVCGGKHSCEHIIANIKGREDGSRFVNAFCLLECGKD